MNKHESVQPDIEGLERKPEAHKIDAKDQIHDAGRQRLDAIKGGFRSFREGLIGRFRNMGKNIETGVMYALGAPEAARAGGRTIGHAGAETGRAVKHGAESVGRGVRTGAEVAVGATIYGAERVGQGARAGYKKGKEAVGVGKEWVVEKATGIQDRAMAARDTFASRVEGVRDDYQQRLATRQAQREREPEYIEYQKLAGQRAELLAAVNRLVQLEERFGPKPTE